MLKKINLFTDLIVNLIGYFIYFTDIGVKKQKFVVYEGQRLNLLPEIF